MNEKQEDQQIKVYCAHRSYVDTDLGNEKCTICKAVRMRDESVWPEIVIGYIKKEIRLTIL